MQYNNIAILQYCGSAIKSEDKPSALDFQNNTAYNADKKTKQEMMELELDAIYNEDCLEGMKRIPDKSVDCIITDPPYMVDNKGGGFWSNAKEGNHYNARGTRKGMERLRDIKDGFNPAALDEMCRIMKSINLYIFCSQKQLRQHLDYFVDQKNCNWNLLCWHKTNPIPACGNKYLNDTEFILFFRERGVQLAGRYDTKRTFYTSPRNQEDNKHYGHPTVKPLWIVRNLIVNSVPVGGVVLDPFIGSGTTAVAALSEGRHYIGFETNRTYYETALKRIKEQKNYDTEDNKRGIP